MNFNDLDTVVLQKHLPENILRCVALRCGDVGAVVTVYEPDGLEVEFVTGGGKTQAVVTLNTNDVRLVDGSDILAVRSMNAA
ncbi:MAG: DUF4926 domain-containing protein [Psychrosphaera sp.]|nr:DUF4926 domain-containing protein [Psychrosphaera sp.]